MRVPRLAAMLAVLVVCSSLALADGGGPATPATEPTVGQAAPAPPAPAPPTTSTAPGKGEAQPMPGPSAPSTTAPGPGAESAPPAVPHVPGEVVNGGFEDGLKGWAVLPTGSDACMADPASAKSGKRSLRLSCTRGGVTTSASQEIPLLGKVGRLSVSLWTRCTLGGPSRLAVRIELLDKMKSVISRRYLQIVPTDARNWVELAGAVEVPAEASTTRLTLRLVATGALWVDDVKVKFDPAKLLFAARQVVCVEGQAGKIHLKPLIRPATAPTATIDKKDAAVTVDGDALAVEVPALKQGRHTLTFSSEGATDSLVLWAVPAASKAKQVSDNGWWLVDGRPALPSIMMHALLPDVPSTTAQGFSMAEILAPKSPDALRRVLKSASKMRTPLLVSFGMPAPAAVEQWQTNLVHMMRENGPDNHVGGWLVANEPDVTISNLDVPAVCLDARSSDTIHPTAITVAGTDQLEFWHKFGDVIFLNLAGNSKNCARTYSALHLAATKLDKDQVLGAILSAGWQPGCVQPDLSHARLMAFTAIAGGARCLAWYCLHSTGWDLRSTPLWTGMKDLNRDLGILASAVAGHDVASDVAVEGSSVPWIAWNEGDSRLLLATNPGSAPEVVTVKAGKPIKSATGIVYEASTDVADGVAKVTIKPGGVSIVRLGFTAPAAKSKAPPSGAKPGTAPPPGSNPGASGLKPSGVKAPRVAPKLPSK